MTCHRRRSRSLLPPLAAALLAVVTSAGVPVAPSAEAQSQELDALLEKVAASVQLFVDDLTNVVAEEQYSQQFRQAAPRRRLKSDFLLVRYPGEERVFVTFRDVMEVDGRAVRDQDRILKLFTEPYADALRRANEIQREGSSHSVQRGRLMNPLDIMSFLQADYQKNFKFALHGFERSLGPDVREIEMTQVIEPGTSQQPIRGTAWVSSATGAVVKTELKTGVGSAMRLTSTTFVVDPTLKIRVPDEMRDFVPMTMNDEYLGVARYANFRRFQIQSAQQIDLPQ